MWMFARRYWMDIHILRMTGIKNWFYGKGLSAQVPQKAESHI